MPDYQTMYFTLFNAITDAVHLLQEAQQKTEEIYMEEQAVSDIREPVQEKMPDR